MKDIYFITATNTDVGKSYASEVFLKKFASMGKKVGYLKPIETGVEDNKPLDGTKLLKIATSLNSDFKVSIKDVVPYQFSLAAAPYVADIYSVVDIDLIIKQIKYLLNFCDTLIIEGAGGLMVPIKENYFIIDLIKDIQDIYNSQTILISPSNLGSINDTMLSQKALESYSINYEWYINLYKDKDSFDEITLPFYESCFNTIQFL